MSRKDGSQDVFENLALCVCLVDLWKRIIVSVSRIKAVKTFFTRLPRVTVAARQWVGFVTTMCVLSRAWLKMAADTSSCSGLFNHSCLCQDAAAPARLKVFVGFSHTSL